jgi:hypothetical protein
LTRERSCVAAEILSALENIRSLEQTLLDVSERRSLRVQGREVAASFATAA